MRVTSKQDMSELKAMTKPDALKLLQFNSRGRKNFHKDQARYWLANAETLQQDFKTAKNADERKSAEFYYLKSLERVDAHLTLINR